MASGEKVFRFRATGHLGLKARNNLYHQTTELTVVKETLERSEEDKENS